MIDWHKRHVDFWKSKLGVSDYDMRWFAFIGGVVLGLLVYQFGVAT